MTIKAKDLPEVVSSEWLNEYLGKHKLGRSDVPALSVSAQVLATELFEEMELLTMQATSSALPALNEAFDRLTEQLNVIKQECQTSSVPESFQPARLSTLFRTIADLNRARSNLETVRDRLTSGSSTYS